MDVVICMAARDFRIVKKTIRGLRRYVINNSDIIYLITKSSNRRLFCVGWFAKNNVILLDEDNLVTGLTYGGLQEIVSKHFDYQEKAGWYLQQFLKMGFALSKYAKEKYLIWDSDTIPLRNISLVTAEGKCYLAAKTEYHKPYFDTMERLLGFGKQEDFSYIAEHMVIEVKYMRELIERIERASANGVYWFEKIINASSKTDVGTFSEFETYGSFCSKYHPGVFEIRELRTLREAGMLFGHSVTPEELETLGRMGFDTASFESYDVPFNHRGWINRFDRRLIKMINWYDKIFKK